MTLTYQRVTHKADKGRFAFRSTKTQNEPMFCLQLLNPASLAGTDFLDRFHTSRPVEEDFLQLLVEREKRGSGEGNEETSTQAF